MSKNKEKNLEELSIKTMLIKTVIAFALWGILGPIISFLQKEFTQQVTVMQVTHDMTFQEANLYMKFIRAMMLVYLLPGLIFMKEFRVFFKKLIK